MTQANFLLGAIVDLFDGHLILFTPRYSDVRVKIVEFGRTQCYLLVLLPNSQQMNEGGAHPDLTRKML